MDSWCTPEWVGMIHATFTLVVSTSEWDGKGRYQVGKLRNKDGIRR